MQYRPEIDGLRTIAVMSVIFYHAQIVLSGRDWFMGGFVGVDVFFVISGYLITRLILSELKQTSRFDIKLFYERRARRIFPALCLVIICSFPFAWKYLLPTDFIEYAQSIIAATFFSSNIYFAATLGDYGAETALLKPFLHTWSLGVEEQFYIIIPLLLMITHRFFSKHVLTVLAAMIASSLLFATLFQAYNAQLNFFLPMSRFWEIGVGAFFADLEIKYGAIRRNLSTTLLSLMGVVMIGFAVATYNDQTTAHPALPTLIPVIGAAMIIAYGSDRDVIGRVLSSKPFVLIGLISYSAYLWHYPIFAFGRMRDSAPSLLDKGVWIALTLCLSALTYKLVEQPFRNWALIKSKQFWMAFCGAIITILLVAIISLWQNGFDHRVPSSLRAGFNKKVHNQVRQDGRICHNRVTDFCESNIGAPTKLYVIGDSVVASAMPEILKEFPNYHIFQLTNGACYYSPDTHKLTPQGAIRKDKCTRTYQNGIRDMLLAETQPSVVLIGGQLGDYIDDETRFATDAGETMTAQYILNSLRQLSINPNLSLYVAKPTPLYKAQAYDAVLGEAMRGGLTTLKTLSHGEDRAKYEAQLLNTREFFANITEKGIGTVLSPGEALCNSETCFAIKDGTPFVVDKHHLAEAGGKAYAITLREAIDAPP